MFPVATAVFWVYIQPLIKLKIKCEIYSIKVFYFKYVVKLNAAFSGLIDKQIG